MNTHHFLVMKSTKLFSNRKFIAVVVIGLLVGLNCSDLLAYGGHRKPHGTHHKHRGGDRGTVGAPLDGGLLTILLGGAGIAYFARKKKKSE